MNWFSGNHLEPTITVPFNIWTGSDGLEIYEQIHVDTTNRIIHMTFLPGVFYGVFRAIPALFSNVIPPYMTIINILAVYTLYYSTFDPLGAYYALLFNIPSAVLAHNHLNHSTRNKSIQVGSNLLLMSLLIQEVIGHSIFEQENSRLTVSYVFNAIMYSPLFQAKDLLLHINPIIVNSLSVIFISLFLC